MPIILGSFLQPSGSLGTLMEDVYLRGSLRVLSTYADRDNIPNLSKKEGMVVKVLADQTFWQLESDRTTWTPAKFEKLSSLFSRTIDGALTLNVTPEEGKALAFNSSGELETQSIVTSSTLDAALGSEVNYVEVFETELNS